MTEWRRARDAGLLLGKPTGETVGRPSAEQAEIARLRRELQLARTEMARTEMARTEMARTEMALTIMGKARELLEGISGSEPNDPDVFGPGKR